MSGWLEEGAMFLRQDEKVASSADAPAELRTALRQEMDRHAEYMKNPAEAIRHLMGKVDSLRIALGQIAYAESEGMGCEQLVRAMREEAKKAAKWADDLPDDRPRLELVL